MRVTIIYRLLSGLAQPRLVLTLPCACPWTCSFFSTEQPVGSRENVDPVPLLRQLQWLLFFLSHGQLEPKSFQWPTWPHTTWSPDLSELSSSLLVCRPCILTVSPQTCSFACRDPSDTPMSHSLTLSGLCSSVLSSERPSYLKYVSFYLKVSLLYYPGRL